MSNKFMDKKIVDKMPKDYVEPLHMTYEEFLEVKDFPEGTRELKTDLKPSYPQVLLNVVYANKENKNLHLQIIEPASLEGDDNNKTYPLIMWVQGSAFHKQSLGDHMAHMIEVAKPGFVVAMVEYRYAPEDAFPVQVRDLNTATRFMLEHAAQYHVDKNNYLVWGDSSGGHTVSLATVTEDEQFFSDEDISTLPLHFKACVDFYGPTDISYMNKVPSTQDHVTSHSLEGEFFGSKNIYDHPKLVQKANPAKHLHGKKLPPFLIMHGTKDRLVPFEESKLFYEALKANDDQVDFYAVKGSDHGSDAFFTPEALKIVFNFINSHLR